MVRISRRWYGYLWVWQNRIKGSYTRLSDIKYILIGEWFDIWFSVDMCSGSAKCDCCFFLSYKLKNAMTSCECYFFVLIFVILMLNGRISLFWGKIIVSLLLYYFLLWSIILWCMLGICPHKFIMVLVAEKCKWRDQISWVLFLLYGTFALLDTE